MHIQPRTIRPRVMATVSPSSCEEPVILTPTSGPTPRCSVHARYLAVHPHPLGLSKRGSAQPPLATLVVLHVTVGLPGAHLREAQVELLDVRVLAQRGGGPFQHDPA